MNENAQTQSDHDLLIELRTEMRSLREEIKKMNDGSTDRIADHEIRLRKIEKYVWLAIGALSIVQVIIAFYLNYKK